LVRREYFNFFFINLTCVFRTFFNKIISILNISILSYMSTRLICYLYPMDEYDHSWHARIYIIVGPKLSWYLVPPKSQHTSRKEYDWLSGFQDYCWSEISSGNYFILLDNVDIIVKKFWVRKYKFWYRIIFIRPFYQKKRFHTIIGLLLI
jgi:hypothetical protein